MKKKKSGGGGANWMDTYGDMVTLLLCFFVLLYSISTMDEQKWATLVESLNPDAAAALSNSVSEDASEDADPNEKSEPVDSKQAMEDLYQQLKEYVDEKQLQNNVSVMKGEGYTFITFQDAVFFNGDSYVLLDSGKVILDGIADALANVSESIDEIQVLGHTSQASPNQPNNVTVDRFLSSNRATTVLVYLQEKNIVDAEKLVSVGYGQFRPVASFDTPVDRAKNRRVELIITGISADGESSIAKYYSKRQTAGE